MAAKTKKQPKRTRPSKVKQEVIEEMRPTRNDDIEAKALAYVNVRDQRMELTKQETACNSELMQAMKNAGEEKYETEDGMIVEISHDMVEKVTVRRPKKEGE